MKPLRDVGEVAVGARVSGCYFFEAAGVTSSLEQGLVCGFT